MVHPIKYRSPKQKKNAVVAEVLFQFCLERDQKHLRMLEIKMLKVESGKLRDRLTRP